MLARVCRMGTDAATADRIGGPRDRLSPSACPSNGRLGEVSGPTPATYTSFDIAWIGMVGNEPSEPPPVKYPSALGYMGCVRRIVKPVKRSWTRPTSWRLGGIALLAFVVGAFSPCSIAQLQKGDIPGDSIPGEERPVRFRVEIDGSRHYETMLRERLPL